jgi:hypothetical protein
MSPIARDSRASEEKNFEIAEDDLGATLGVVRETFWWLLRVSAISFFSDCPLARGIAPTKKSQIPAET